MRELSGGKLPQGAWHPTAYTTRSRTHTPGNTKNVDEGKVIDIQRKWKQEKNYEFLDTTSNQPPGGLKCDPKGGAVWYLQALKMYLPCQLTTHTSFRAMKLSTSTTKLKLRMCYLFLALSFTGNSQSTYKLNNTQFIQTNQLLTRPQIRKAKRKSHCYWQHMVVLITDSINKECTKKCHFILMS